MNKRQFAMLFVAMAAIWTVANGLMPLLPVYALQLGGTPTLAGYLLAFAMLALSCGVMASGWLSDRTGRRKLWLLVICVVAPATLLGMGLVRSFWLFSALTGLLWFTVGMAVGLSLVLVGLRADPEERGRLFGILSMVSPLSALIGGATFGAAADQWGYPAMIRLTGGLYGVPFVLLWFFHDPPTPSRRATRERAAQPEAQASVVGKPGVGVLGLGRALYLLLLATFIAAVGLFVVRMVRSLAMARAGFSAAAIASTGVAMGLVLLPLMPLAGWLSDRLGRKTLVMACFVAALLGRCWLVAASQLWHFWGGMALDAMAGVVEPVKSAWVSDLAPRESLGRAMSIVGVSGWVGGVLGFGLAGLAVEHLGITWTFAITALSMLLAIALLIPVRMAAAPRAAAAVLD